MLNKDERMSFHSHHNGFIFAAFALKCKTDMEFLIRILLSKLLYENHFVFKRLSLVRIYC